MSAQKRKVTYMDLSKCVATEEDTLPDINTEEFTGAQEMKEHITGTRVTGAHITGAQNNIKEETVVTGILVTAAIEGNWIFMSTHFTGTQDLEESLFSFVTSTQENSNNSVTGTPATGALNKNMTITGAPITGTPISHSRETPDRISKIRRRLSVSLRKAEHYRILIMQMLMKVKNLLNT